MVHKVWGIKYCGAECGAQSMGEQSVEAQNAGSPKCSAHSVYNQAMNTKQLM